MALKANLVKAYTVDGSLRVPGYGRKIERRNLEGCYVKVAEVTATASEVVASVDYKWNGAIVHRAAYRFAPDMDSGENFIAQAYAHLKGLDEFKGATDA